MSVHHLAVKSTLPPSAVTAGLAQNGDSVPDLERNLVCLHRREIVLGFTVGQHLRIRLEARNYHTHATDNIFNVSQKDTVYHALAGA